MRKRLAALTAALLVLCGCSAVQMERKRPEYAISVVLKAMNSHYWMDMRAGMEQAAVDCGIDLRLLYPSGELEVEEQNDQIADVLESDTDLLMVAPCDSYHTKWFVDQAEEKGIPVLAVDTRTLDCEIPYIGADNEKIGKMAADYLKETLPNGGTVVIFAGARNQGSQVDRVRAFRDELAPSLKISRIFYTDITMSDGYESGKELAGQKVDAVFCTSAVIGLGVATAFTETEQEAVIVAVDTQDDALQALQDGTMNALISQSGYEIGYRAINIAVNTLKSGRMPENVLIPGELLTKDSELKD